MDISTTKVLSIHVPALLPPTSTELNVPHNVQVAAVLGVGLVFQGTAYLMG
jgi:anaphase-promoting complex subunit 1